MLIIPFNLVNLTFYDKSNMIDLPIIYENQCNLQSSLKTVESYKSLSQTLAFHEDVYRRVVCVGRRVQL